MRVIALAAVGCFALVILGLVAGLVVLLATVTRRSRRAQEAHSARITREIEKIARFSGHV